MSSQYIIERFGRKVGLNPDDINQRYVILDFVNEALQTIYEYVDIPGSLVEEEFYVAGNKRIAMSRDVQSIRAMREKESKLPWKSQNLISEYNFNNWRSDSRCFRIVGYSAIKESLKSAITAARGSNATGVTVKAHGQISAETLHVTFETRQANSLAVLQNKVVSYVATTGNHAVSTSELQLDNTNIISDIVNIRRFDNATRERYGTSTAAEQIPGIFQVVDTADGTVYAEIPSGQSESSYLIVDVSEFPWDENSAQDDEHTLQILYKKKLRYIQSNDDIFPLVGYENIVMHKAMQLFLEEQGKIQEALVFENKVNRDLGRKIADMERGQERKMQFGRHPHDNLTLGRRFHYHRG
tara:strand:- start:24966 stop:26030 length:1065 start_codon:yes stop_codon:yes gene_type:complete